MPTALQGDNFVHTCQHCGHPNTDSRSKPLPFMFSGYRCTSCGRPLDDLDYDLLSKKNAARRKPDGTTPP